MSKLSTKKLNPLCWPWVGSAILCQKLLSPPTLLIGSRRWWGDRSGRERCQELQFSQWARATVPQCHGATVPQCHGAPMPRCPNATVTRCHSASLPQCARMSEFSSLIRLKLLGPTINTIGGGPTWWEFRERPSQVGLFREVQSGHTW